VSYSEFVVSDLSQNTTNPSKAELRGQVYGWAGGTDGFSTAANRQDCLRNVTGLSGRWERGSGWAWSFMGNGNTYSHTMMPNEKSCHIFNGGDDWYGFTMHSASSEHPGGVNVAMADGAVRFVSQSVSEQVWWAVGTRNGGEQNSLDQ
jgi:prepilin-type processing-associated H-X9-DG protein